MAASILTAFTSTTVLNPTLNCGAGSNRLVIAAIGFEGAPDVTAPSWGSVVGTLIIEKGVGGGDGALRTSVYMWNEAAVGLQNGSAFSTAMTDWVFAYGCLQDAAQATPTDLTSLFTGAATPNPVTTIDLAVPAGCVSVAVSGTGSDTTYTWTGATERVDKSDLSVNGGHALSLAVDAQASAVTFAPRGTIASQNRRHDINFYVAGFVGIGARTAKYVGQPMIRGPF